MKIQNNITSKVVAASLVVLLGTSSVFAGTLTSVSDALSSVKVSTLSGHTIRFTTPTAINTNGNTIVLTFASGFNFTSKTIGTVSFTHGATTGAENTETLAASPSASAWGAVFSGTNNVILTLTAPTDGVGSASVAANDKIIINYDSTNSTNPGSASTYSLGVITPSDTGTTTINIINNDTVAVSATVAQSITFSISSNSINFGTLGSGAAKYASSTNSSGDTSDVVAHTLAVSTNASQGYTLTVQGATLNTGVLPLSATNTIAQIGSSPATSSIGTEQFGIYATKSGGVNGTIATPFATPSSFGYNGTTSSAVTFASGTSATQTETYSLHYLANVAGTTEAGTYTANLVYVSTANF